MPQERDPFPFPRYENDYTLTGSKEIQKLPYDRPTHLAQDDEPWRRLHNTTTQASSLELYFIMIPQHQRTKETVVLDNGTLKNKESEDSMCETENKGMRLWVDTQKASIYSIKGSIESHHTASTNRGYSRKHDGGFYST
ncbi:hypothetical protein QQF64_032211 [Cirrhinus molitorella]|uniref:Uncharacterized protein n=1 Tax=Cirrhinus molitorella TaxID=172907 RepID=A0ABR3MZ96_9TELE